MIYIELCIVGYIINRDTFTETLIKATIPVLEPRKGFRNKAPKKNVELNARMGEWRDTDVYIYAQCTGPGSGPFESTRTSRLDDREEIEICDDCADEISVSLNGGPGPSRVYSWVKGVRASLEAQTGVAEVVRVYTHSLLLLNRSMKYSDVYIDIFQLLYIQFKNILSSLFFNI